MDLSTGTVLIVGLAVAWTLQYLLSFWQMRRYYNRLAELRRRGVVSVGLAGSAWRRRQYAVLVLDKLDRERIVCVEQLSGWTVMATLKPVPGLEGRRTGELLDDQVQLPVSPKLRLALRDAVKHLREHEARMAAKARRAQEEKESESGTESPAGDHALVDSSLSI